MLDVSHNTMVCKKLWLLMHLRFHEQRKFLSQIIFDNCTNCMAIFFLSISFCFRIRSATAWNARKPRKFRTHFFFEFPNRNNSSRQTVKTIKYFINCCPTIYYIYVRKTYYFQDHIDPKGISATLKLNKWKSSGQCSIALQKCPHK